MTDVRCQMSYRLHSCLNRSRHSNETPTIVPIPGQLTLIWKRYQMSEDGDQISVIRHLTSDCRDRQRPRESVGRKPHDRKGPSPRGTLTETRSQRSPCAGERE